MLTILDDGAGMKRSAGADLIGLQLAPLLAQQVNGRIGREDGNGTTFRITFPVRHRAVAEA